MNSPEHRRTYRAFLGRTTPAIVTAELRDLLLEVLYAENPGRWASELAQAIHRADVALGQGHYGDIGLRYLALERNRTRHRHRKARAA